MIFGRKVALLTVTLAVPTGQAAGLDSDLEGSPSGEVESLRAAFVEASPHFAKGRSSGDEPEGFTCTNDAVKATISKRGMVEWSAYGGRSNVAKLPLPDRASEGFIQRLWCTVADGDLILAYRSDYFGPDGDAAGGAVSRLGSPSGKAKWTIYLLDYIGEPLRDSNAIYVTALGFVGKIDVKSGRFAWRHGGLFRNPGVYNSFAKPIREAGRVVFPAVHYNSGNAIPGSWPRALVVDDSSGRILEGKPK